MRVQQLRSSHRKVVHIVALEDGYEDFDHQGYWTKIRKCRPAELTITHERFTRGDADQPGEWSLRLVLSVWWVRKDDTVSGEKSDLHEVYLVLPGASTWRNAMEAPPWVIPLIELYDVEYDSAPKNCNKEA
jgi:hypothetical protein